MPARDELQQRKIDLISQMMEQLAQESELLAINAAIESTRAANATYIDIAETLREHTRCHRTATLDLAKNLLDDNPPAVAEILAKLNIRRTTELLNQITKAPNVPRGHRT